MFDYALVQRQLVVKENMDLVQAAILAADIMNYYDENIVNAIMLWAKDEDVDKFNLDGTSVADLMYEIGCSAFGALALLNAIKKNPGSLDEAILVREEDTIE